jgi:hypothetical protein
MALDGRDRLALSEARTALKRIGPGWRFERARPAGSKPVIGGRRVERLVGQGFMRWVNACRSAAVLTDEGESAGDPRRARPASAPRAGAS